jgi:hypothetical protein
MNDIDILIPKEQADSALKVFRGLHYFCAGELLGNSPENQKDVSHHLPPFFSRDLHCMIGTHWGFINPLVGINPNYDIIWSRAKEFNYHGVNCYHLSPEDNLLHLCIHLSLYKSGIKEVADIYNLILSTEIDWSYFIDHAKSANALSSVVLALTVSQTLYSIPKVSEILLQLKNDQDLSPSVDTLKKCQSRSFLLRTRTTYVTLLDKEFIQFKSTQVFGEKLHSFIKIWSLLLFPPTDEAQKLTFRSHSNYITAIYAPIKIVTHLCHELGTKIFFLLHVYLIYSLAKSLFRNLFNVKKKGFSEYAHDLGLSTEDIALLKMRLE